MGQVIREFSSAIWIKQLFWLSARDISAADNGTSGAQCETVPHRCFGNPRAQLGLAVGKPGAGRLLTNLNLMMRQIGRMVDRPKLNRN
jgi:hypothetical protein